ncbi:hypothetical protein BK769_12670 [Bacillus thuringiensis serovar kumamtoensis]|uniref:Uncharacterized protein n=1 Tax=Bacillus thuringiensis serovar kumamotoensis TaxID=132267 RepID=A0A9X6JRL4_BACUK|nr:hypothetical protein BK769_12670 [Bacillus thuringiensis serovar kumamtoensis]
MFCYAKVNQRKWFTFFIYSLARMYFNSVLGVTIHAHQLKDGYKTKFCSFELKSLQMGGFIKNKHAK